MRIFGLCCVGVVFAATYSASPTAKATPVLPAVAQNNAILTTRGNASPEPIIKVGLSPWPDYQYDIPLSSDYVLLVSGAPYYQAPKPPIPSIRRFIYEFMNDIEDAYPPPGLSPRRATLKHYDGIRFTVYRISEEVLPIFTSFAPSAILLEALNVLAGEIRNHGTPRTIIASITKNRGRFLPRELFNLIQLDIAPLGPQSGLQQNRTKY